MQRLPARLLKGAYGVAKREYVSSTIYRKGERGLYQSTERRVYMAIWTKMDNVYTAEESTLIGNQKFGCPKCGEDYRNINNVEVQRSEEGEIQIWIRTCSCGAELHIFND